MATVSVGLLRGTPLFADANPEVLEALAAVALERHYRTGEEVLREGERGGSMYLVLEGSLQVFKGQGQDAILLAERSAGEIVGEMAFLEDRPRFATVRAASPSRLLEFTGSEITLALLSQPSLLYRVVQTVSSKLRASDLQMISDLQRKNAELSQAYKELKAAQDALVEKELMERELDLARDLQQSILPVSFPPAPGCSFAALSRPARQVGGDFYDIVALPRGRIGLVMADVSDKGMPSALFMALTHSLVHAEAKRRSSPRQVLLTVHKLLMEMSRADMFVTVFYGILDPERCTLRYVRAGHDRPILANAKTGDCRFLDASGMLLGMLDDVHLEEAEVTLSSGDVLALYSDGITDANSASGEQFGVDRLQTALCDLSNLTAQEICDRLVEQVDRFQLGSTQYDDMALLVAKLDTLP